MTDGTTWTDDASSTLDGDAAGAADCSDGDSDPWRRVPAPLLTDSTDSAEVARSPLGTTDAAVHLRFGVRPAADQPPGNYSAPVTFKVLAPDPG